jgi:hypothetical protein
MHVHDHTITAVEEGIAVDELTPQLLLLFTDTAQHLPGNLWHHCLATLTATPNRALYPPAGSTYAKGSESSSATPSPTPSQRRNPGRSTNATTSPPRPISCGVVS